jgi:tetratricopeptide (TPR) repeat protein
MESKVTGEALARLKRLEGYLTADPDNRTLLADVIGQALTAGQHDSAERHVQTALARFPDDAQLQGLQGHVLLAQQRWSDAADYFHVLLARHPDPNLAYNLAFACQRCARHADAVAALLPFAAQLSASAAAVLLRSLHHTGELEQAIALIAAQEASGRVDAEFFAVASAICLDADALEEAERLCQAAVAGGAAPIEALVVGGSVALARTDTGTARPLLEQAIERNPREGRAWSSLGLASLLDRDLANADVQLAKAVELMPTHIGSWHALGWCKLFRGDLAAAEAAFRHALDMDRNFGESHGGLAVVQAMLGQREQAEGGIDRALRLDPQSLSARYAQMILSGVAADPEKFHAMARRLLSGRAGPFGADMAQLVLAARGH